MEPPLERRLKARDELIAELLEALDGMLKIHHRIMEDFPHEKMSFGLAQMVLGARDKATEAIRKAKHELITEIDEFYPQ